MMSLRIYKFVIEVSRSCNLAVYVTIRLAVIIAINCVLAMDVTCAFRGCNHVLMPPRIQPCAVFAVDVTIALFFPVAVTICSARCGSNHAQCLSWLVTMCYGRRVYNHALWDTVLFAIFSMRYCTIRYILLVTLYYALL